MPTNFLQESGFLAAPYSVLTTELNALGSGASTTSSVGGTSGAFSQTQTAQGIWGIAHFNAGGAFTPTAGGYLAIWALYSPDGGTTYEKTVASTDLPRPPDIVIPLFASAYASADKAQSSGIIRMPWWTHKFFIVNHAGVALPATGNIIQVATVAVQY